MVINPVFFVISLYFFANLYSTIKGISLGGFYFYSSFNPVTTSAFLIAFVLQVIFLLLILSMSFVFFRKKSYQRPNLHIGNKVACFLIFSQALFIFFVFQTGAGKAGSDFSFQGANIFNYFFIALKPDLLVILLAPFLVSGRAFKLTMIIYFVSLMVRGWMGAIYFIGLLYLIRYYPIRITIRVIPKFIFIIVILFLSLPILEALKWAMRGEFIPLLFFGQIKDGLSLDLYFSVLEYIITRFAHVNNIALIIENSDIFSIAFGRGEFRSLWMSGVIYEVFCRIIGSCGVELGTFLAVQYYGSPGSWNADPGLLSWIFITPLQGSLLSFFLIPFYLYFSYFFSKYYGLKGTLLFLTFSVIYLFHGWYSAFANFFLYQVFVLLLAPLFLKRISLSGRNI